MRDLRVSPQADAAANDAMFRNAFTEPTRVLLDDGIYPTAGLAEWNRNRADRGFVMNGSIESAGASKATLMLDPLAIVDADISDEPQRIITGRGVWDDPTTGALTPTGYEEAVRRIPRGQAVRNVRLVGNHSLLVPRWRAAGFSLRTSGVMLIGHAPVVDGVELIDFGAWRLNPNVGAETFPISIVGASSEFDTTAIARYEWTYPGALVFEPAQITNSLFDGYVSSASNDQVSVGVITGAFGESNGWKGGDWRFTWRSDSLIQGNRVKAKGSNHVQGFTIYLSQKGTCRKNTTDGADIGYYVDYLQSRRTTVEENSFTGGRHGIALYLSPGPPADLAREFFHEDVEIGINKIESSGAQVSISTNEVEWLAECKQAIVPPTPNSRRITGIRIHNSIARIENSGGEVTRFGEDLNKRKGCRLF